MFFISSGVASRIRSLGRREDVQRELEAIRAMPTFELYANAIAEGVGAAHKRTGAAASHRRDAEPEPKT